MKKKIFSSFLMVLIISGIIFSLVNFSTNAYAGGGYVAGTTTMGTSLLLTSWWELNGRHLYDNYYCVWDPSDCMIVFAN